MTKTQPTKKQVATRPKKFVLSEAHNIKDAIRKNKEGIILVMCDNGSVDGKYLEGVLYTVMNTEVPIVSAMRVQGNQIGRQRQQAFNTWMDKTDFEWSLWIDSDVVLTKESLALVWNASHPEDRPAVSGIYFISKDNEQSLPRPFPALFTFTEEQHQMKHIHPLPENQLIQVGAAGFGFLLLHRSVGKKLREKFGENAGLFAELGTGDSFISEDINFFTKMFQADIPLFAHTGALARHIKRFSLDVEYYKVYWGDSLNVEQIVEETKDEEETVNED